MHRSSDNQDKRALDDRWIVVAHNSLVRVITLDDAWNNSLQELGIA